MHGELTYEGGTSISSGNCKDIRSPIHRARFSLIVGRGGIPLASSSPSPLRVMGCDMGLEGGLYSELDGYIGNMSGIWFSMVDRV